MEVYWKERKNGQRLVCVKEGENEVIEIGGVRLTKNGYDAFAKTFGYDPGRAMRGIPNVDEAKSFVESFRPWELFGSGDGITVESEVRSDD